MKIRVEVTVKEEMIDWIRQNGHISRKAALESIRKQVSTQAWNGINWYRPVVDSEGDLDWCHVDDELDDQDVVYDAS